MERIKSSKKKKPTRPEEHDGIPIDYSDKIYEEGNKGAVSVGAYNNLLEEAQYRM